MIARILLKPSKVFAGVKYNSNKVDRNKGELMLTANFGALQGLQNPKPQDLTHYLLMIAAQNKGVRNTQFHAVISSPGHTYDKTELTRAAVMWLKEMQYGEQPYIIVFHKDTDNSHVHIVSSRIARDGKQIDRDFEWIRSVRNIDKVLGYTHALKYNFSTKAQFYLILENGGFLGREYYNLKKLQSKINHYKPDHKRIAELKELFIAQKSRPDFVKKMKASYQLDLIFHSSEGKKPYGYSVIDHATKQVFKGSEILNLKALMDEHIDFDSPKKEMDFNIREYLDTGSMTYYAESPVASVHIRPVSIADDVDDQQVLGMKRRRQKKARTNTR